MSQVLLRKNGYFYRPDWRGYTASALEAGRYDRSEAERHIANTEGVSIVEDDSKERESWLR